MPTSTTKQEEDRYSELQMMALDFARQGETSELKKMIDHGMSVNLCSHRDDTLIMLSAYRGHFDTTKMLIDCGGDMDRKNARGQTPLHGVCFKGNLEITKLLVQNNATIDSKAILFAGLFGNKDILEFLQNTQKIPFTIKLLSKITAFLKYVFFRKAKQGA